MPGHQAIELRLRFDGDVEFTSEVETTSFDYRTVETAFPIAARSQFAYPFTVSIHHGTNAKQKRVKLR